MEDFTRLILRATTGPLLAGHGTQKLFGAFSGPGMEGTRGMMEALGLKPAERWAFLAGASELGGGALTALGLFNPIGSLGIIASMTMATRKAHWGKPIWVTEGGAELPVTNIAISTALLVGGPGRYSLDNALDIRLPRWVGPVGLAAILATVAVAAQQGEPEESEEEQPTEEGEHE